MELSLNCSCKLKFTATFGFLNGTSQLLIFNTCFLVDCFVFPSLQRDPIIETFYEKHLGQLIDVITSSCPPNDAALPVSESAGSSGYTGIQNSARPEILLNICDFLSFCVMHHPYRIK